MAALCIIRGHMLALDTIAVDAPVVQLAPPAVRPWPLPTRIAFRFCFIYFSLYVALTQMLSGLLVLPVGRIPPPGNLDIVTGTVQWTARKVFGVVQPLVITGSGSGDKTFDWVFAFCLLVFSATATIVWSAAAARRARLRPFRNAGRTYAGFHKWFRLFLRFSLGSTLVSYGAAKAIPLQRPFPNLTRLLEPCGHFSPMGVLWYSIGASRPYEIFTGCAELLAGLLLFIPGTATLGALFSLAVTGQIFTLNMTYDVPVKLFSFHLILMSLFLLAPDARRLLNVLVLNRPAAPSSVPPLGRSRRAIRIGMALQVVFGIYLISMAMYGSVQRWSEFGGGAPKSALYGIWDVDYMSVDGVERSALVGDYGRWRRVIFDTPAAVAFQRMDDTFVRYGNAIDLTARTVSLTKQSDRSWKANFTLDRPAAERLVLRGQMDGGQIELRMTLLPREKFLLTTRGFNWIQEFPFNR